jgi:peptidyl-prolyl cis-trans isomerase A (cyclophilin A)
MTLSRRIVLTGLMAAATALSPLAAMAQGASPATAAPKTERVQFVTSAGKFTIELYPDAAPKTVANFMGYVKRLLFRHDLPSRDQRLHGPGRRL